MASPSETLACNKGTPTFTRSTHFNLHPCRYFRGHKALEHACKAEERLESNAYQLRAELRHHEQLLLDHLENV